MTTKTATVLMSDLVSSTELAVQIGDETAAAVFRAHLATVRSLVEQNGGTLVKLMGDGALAWFDSTAAAIDCAASIHRSTERGDRRLPSALQVRVSLSAGEILLSEDGDVYGTPVNEAARLCSITPPGEILASEVVIALAGSRQTRPCRRLAPVQLKGFSAPVTPVEIQWQTAEMSQQLPRSLERANRRGPCLGRDAAIDSLRSALEAVELGEDRVALVVGEAGIGKSRLAGAFAERAVSRGSLVAYGWCDPQFQPAYQPWVEALGPLTTRLTRDQLRRIDPSDDLARILPGFPEPEIGRDASFNADAARQRLFAAVGNLLGVSDGTPSTVVVLDDAHWIDPASVSLLRSLLRSGHSRHLLVVVCTRPSGLEPGQPLAALALELDRSGDLDRIDLAGLDRAAVSALVEEATGSVTDDLVDSLSRLTDGNPFLVGQLLQHPQIAESGTVGVVPSSVLAGVRQLVDESVRSLPPLAHQLVRLAAVYGRDVDLRTVSAFADADRADCVEALDLAIRSGLLVEHGDGAIGFNHQITRDAVYDQLSGPVRSDLHWTIGTALSAAPGSEPSIVAHHLCSGIASGEPEVAVVAALDATDDAASRSAFEVAYSLAVRAEEILRSGSVERPDLLARALVARAEYGGVMLDASTDRSAALVEASEIAQTLGLTDIMHRAATAFTGYATWGQVDPGLWVVAERALRGLGSDDAARAGVLATVGTAKLLRGDIDGAEHDIDESVEVAERADSNEARYLAYNARSALGQQRPDVERFGTDVVAALDAADAIGGAPWLTITRIRMAMYCVRVGDRVRLDLEHRTYLADESTPDYAVFGRILAGTLAMADGRWAEPEATARFLAGHVPVTSPFYDTVLAHLAANLAGQRRYDEAAEVLDGIPDRSESLAMTLRARRAFLAAARGSTDEARQLLDSVLGSSDASTFDYFQGSVLYDLTHNLLLSGADEHAPDLVGRLEAYAGQLLIGGGVLAIWGPADDLRSRLLERLGDLDGAIAAARSAIGLAQGFGASALVVRSKQHLAHLFARRGGRSDREMAIGHLREALILSAEHEVRADHDAIEASLRALV